MPPRLTYASLDLWRGLASLLVVLYHTAGVHVYHHPDLKSAPLISLALLGDLGVAVFFVISGFCIANAAAVAQARDAHVGPFFLARLRRIFPPYWCAFLFSVALLLALRLLAQRGVGPTTGFATSSLSSLSLGLVMLNLTLTQFLFGQPSILPVSWTLCYELAFYLLVGLALALLGKRGGTQGLLRTLHGLTVLCLVALAFFGPHVPYPFNRWPQFGFGVLVYDALLRRSWRESALWAGAFLSAEALALWRLSGAGAAELRLSTVIASAAAALLLLLHRHDTRLATHPALRWASYLGLLSYSLYLSHFFVLRIVLQAWEKLPLPDPTGALGLSAGALGSVAVAALFYRFFEKPFLKPRSQSQKAKKTDDSHGS